MQSQQCSAAEKGKVAENWAWGEGPELDLEEKAKKEKKSGKCGPRPSPQFLGLMGRSSVC